MSFDKYSVVIVLLGTLAQYFFFRKNVRNRRIWIENQSRLERIDFPVVISIRPWTWRNRLFNLSAVLFVAIPFFSALSFLPLTLVMGRWGLDRDSNCLVMALIVGSVVTFLVCRRFPDLKESNPWEALATKGRELIIEPAVLKISRGLYPGELAGMPEDEPNYYVIPIASSMSVQIQIWRGRYGWREFYDINDRDRTFTLSRDRLGKAETMFVGAVKMLNVRRIDF